MSQNSRWNEVEALGLVLGAAPQESRALIVELILDRVSVLEPRAAQLMGTIVSSLTPTAPSRKSGAASTMPSEANAMRSIRAIGVGLRTQPETTAATVNEPDDLNSEASKVARAPLRERVANIQAKFIELRVDAPDVEAASEAVAAVAAKKNPDQAGVHEALANLQLALDKMWRASVLAETADAVGHFVKEAQRTLNEKGPAE